jgi:hypothetical protein
LAGVAILIALNINQAFKILIGVSSYDQALAFPAQARSEVRRTGMCSQAELRNQLRNQHLRRLTVSLASPLGSPVPRWSKPRFPLAILTKLTKLTKLEIVSANFVNFVNFVIKGVRKRDEPIAVRAVALSPPHGQFFPNPPQRRGRNVRRRGLRFKGEFYGSGSI